MTDLLYTDQKFCIDCTSAILEIANGGTGYATTPEGDFICYTCCAERDKEEMRANGKITLYLVKTDRVNRNAVGLDKPILYQVTNWPGSLQIDVLNRHKSRHNWGLERIDFWFVFEGMYWHGVQIGDTSQLCHCKRTKTPIKPRRKHYVGMAGLHGYMPNYCDVFETRGSAAESLGQIHDLSGRKIAQLRRDCTLELDLYIHGNEYCEIVECECDDPGEHSEDGEYNP